MLALSVLLLVLLHLLQLQRLVLEALEVLVFGLFLPGVLNDNVSTSVDTEQQKRGGGPAPDFSRASGRKKGECQ